MNATILKYILSIYWVLLPHWLYAMPLIAQNEAESNGDEVNLTPQDAYDPFIDYIEFDHPEAVKKDMQFFQQGRFLSLSGLIGGRLFTGEMRSFIQPYVNFGAAGSVFFKFRICRASLFTE